MIPPASTKSLHSETVTVTLTPTNTTPSVMIEIVVTGHRKYNARKPTNYQSCKQAEANCFTLTRVYFQHFKMHLI